MKLNELLPILQAAVSPVILISGVGLLILSMTNRLARVMDRSRQLGDALRQKNSLQPQRLTAQLEILTVRARLLRLAISFAGFSALAAAILVLILFFTELLHWNAVPICILLFAMCLIALISSLLVFLKDINLSLAALELDLKSTGPSDGNG